MTEAGTPGLGTVVVATDGSPGARHAQARLRHLPLRPSARVILAHVLPEGASDPRLTTAVRAQLDREGSALRAGLRRAGRSDVDLGTETPRGSPAIELARLAKERGADLVVCGRHGAGRLRALLLGSTAERTAQLCEVPVLIAGSRATGPYRAALAAVTPDAHARPVVDGALGVLPPRPILELVSGVSVPLEGWLWSGWSSTADVLRLRRKARQDAERTLFPLIASLRGRGTRARLSLREGDPRKLILAAAERKPADLIAVGAHAGALPARLHLGSVSSYVVRHAACDVLVFRVAPAARRRAARGARRRAA
jgi:nucleotide-binding universal stress UspA family protein